MEHALKVSGLPHFLQILLQSMDPVIELHANGLALEIKLQGKNSLFSKECMKVDQ